MVKQEIYPEPIQQTFEPIPNISAPVPMRTVLQGAYECIREPVIDEFQHNSWFFDNMPREIVTDVVNGGASPIYTYYRTANLTSATRRPYYSRPTETYVEIKSEQTSFANLATAVAIDIDLLKYGSKTSQWERQLRGAINGISDLFNEMVIRGDSSTFEETNDPAVGPGSFDGLDKIIRKESLHVWDTEDDTIDLTGLGYSEKVTDTATNNQVWMDVSDQIMYRLRKLRPYPQFILGNDDLISALSTLARRTGTYTAVKNDFGQVIGSMDGISLISMGHKVAKNEDIIQTYTSSTKCRENPTGVKDKTFETKAYVGSFGGNGIIGLEMPGDKETGNGGLLDIRISEIEYVKKALIEMHIGMAVLSKHACGMFERICLPKKVIEDTKHLKPSA